MFYQKKDANKVVCTLCPNDCIINDGNVGFCGVRINKNGTLYSTVYEQISGLAIDPIEKKPLYHFYPGTKVFSAGTFGCNMRCKHCQNWQIAHTGSKFNANPNQQMSALDLVNYAVYHNCRGIALTYNEPTIWFEYAMEVLKYAKENGLYTVFVTAGWINEDPLNMLIPYMDAYSLDIKGFSNEFYKSIAGKDTFQPVLESAINTKRKGVHLEIVTNIIPDYNDDNEQINLMSNWIKTNLGENTPLHLTAFHPAYKVTNKSRTPIKTLYKAYDIAKKNGLNYVYLGNVISDIGSDTYCNNCGELIIKRSKFGDVISTSIKGKCPNCSNKINIIGI